MASGRLSNFTSFSTSRLLTSPLFSCSPSLPNSFKLQERDQRLNNLQRDLKDVPSSASPREGASSQAIRPRLMHCFDLGMREIEVKIKSILEIDIQTRKNTIKRLHDQQFETRKNDEFQALGNEVKRYRKPRSSRMEDK